MGGWNDVRKQQEREGTIMTIISVPLKQRSVRVERREREIHCGSKWLTCVGPSLHFNDTNPSKQGHPSILLIYATNQYFFIKKKGRKKIQWGCVWSRPRQGGPTWLDLEWGPKGGVFEALALYYIPFLREKQNEMGTLHPLGIRRKKERSTN